MPLESEIDPFSLAVLLIVVDMVDGCVTATNSTRREEEKVLPFQPHIAPGLYIRMSLEIPPILNSTNRPFSIPTPREHTPWNRFLRLARILVRNLEVFTIDNNHGDPQYNLPENISRRATPPELPRAQLAGVRQKLDRAEVVGNTPLDMARFVDANGGGAIGAS